MRRLMATLALLCIVLLNVGCDQATKRIARERLEGRGTVHVVDQVVILRYVENTGGFLGLGAGLPRPLRVTLFVAFPVAVLAAMLLYVIRSPRIAAATLTGFAFLLGGGIGNLIDRLMFDGRVSDFINVGVGRLRTGIFNMADLSVMIGCLLLLLGSLRAPRPGSFTP